jgi:hypothetical protein
MCGYGSTQLVGFYDELLTKQLACPIHVMGSKPIRELGFRDQAVLQRVPSRLLLILGLTRT